MLRSIRSKALDFTGSETAGNVFVFVFVAILLSVILLELGQNEFANHLGRYCKNGIVIGKDVRGYCGERKGLSTNDVVVVVHRHAVRRPDVGPQTVGGDFVAGDYL